MGPLVIPLVLAAGKETDGIGIPVLIIVSTLSFTMEVGSAVVAWAKESVAMGTLTVLQVLNVLAIDALRLDILGMETVIYRVFSKTVI